MTEEQLLPCWSYSLPALLETLSALLAQCHEISLLEEKITEVLHCSNLCICLILFSWLELTQKQCVMLFVHVTIPTLLFYTLFYNFFVSSFILIFCFPLLCRYL